MSDARVDEDLQDLIEEFGFEGYGRWWAILETISLQMDKTGKCSVTYSWIRWQSILRGKRKKLECFLNALSMRQKIETKQIGNKLEISCPKLLKLRDNYTKDLEVPKKATDPPASKQEVEVEVEVDLKDLSLRAGEASRGPPVAAVDPPPPDPGGYRSTRAELDDTFRDLTAIPGESLGAGRMIPDHPVRIGPVTGFATAECNRPHAYPMSDDWVPLPAAIEWVCLGMGVDASLITPEATFEFRNFWAGKGYQDTDRGWVGKMIGRIRDQAAKNPMSSPAAEEGFLEKHTDTAWREGLLDPGEGG